jgi:hypothetical protein
MRLLPLAILCGCPLPDKAEDEEASVDGTFVVEAGEAFGEVAGVVWTTASEVDAWMLYGDELVLETRVTLAPQVAWFTEPTTCADVQASWRDAGEAAARLVALSDEGGEAVCEGVAAYLADTDDETATTARLYWCEGDDCGDAPALGDHVVDVDTVMQATVRRPNGRSAADAWDVEACAYADDWAGDATHAWLSPGTATFEVADGGHVAGSLTGELRDEDNALAGTVTATFDTEPCELPDVDALILL